MRSTRNHGRTKALIAAPLMALALLTVTACEDSGGSGSSYGAGAAGPSADQPQPKSPAGSPAEAPEGEQPAADGSADTAAPKQPPAPSISIRTAESDLGTILVDDQGRTLYGFTKDKPGQANCDSDCIAVWPALISAKDVTAGEGTDASLLKEIKLGAGAEQAVYGDWPLYYYVGDVTAGDVNGQGLDGEWFVVAADGKLIKSEA
ncbi:COG4315 family predicted lipoprotein [Streptomyces kurssanovii]|uniref:Lipoprotein n=1 Tax=Streptomyces kurssanovii TaxID=67312 RepID=A0ABV3I1A3_9ACTN